MIDYERIIAAMKTMSGVSLKDSALIHNSGVIGQMELADSRSETALTGLFSAMWLERFELRLAPFPIVLS